MFWRLFGIWFGGMALLGVAWVAQRRQGPKGWKKVDMDAWVRVGRDADAVIVRQGLDYRLQIRTPSAFEDHRSLEDAMAAGERGLGG